MKGALKKNKKRFQEHKQTDSKTIQEQSDLIEQLKQKLTEKEKELSEYVKIVDDLHKQLSDKCDFCDKTHNQDKISFCIEQLEKVKNAFGLINPKLDKVETIKEYICYIDNQIKQLKGE